MYRRNCFINQANNVLCSYVWLCLNKTFQGILYALKSFVLTQLDSLLKKQLWYQQVWL